MLYQSFKLFHESEVTDIKKLIYQSDQWIDGNKTASYNENSHKRNVQLMGSESNGAADIIKTKILEKNLVQSTIFPKLIIGTMFSRCGKNMYYKKHVDMAMTNEGRKDYSFTLFLGDSNEYEGGELILYIPPEIKTVKLNAGEIIFYPTKYLHEVKNVTSGERIVCVGWIESYIQNNESREILATLETSILKINKCSSEGTPANQEDLLNLQLVKERLIKELSH